MERLLHRYIALVRGVNVGGHTLVKMTELRKLFESLGFKDVVTYIQSGNILFSAENAVPEQMAHQIEETLLSSMGLRIKVLVLSPAELKESAANNPFDPEHRDERQRCHIMFLSAAPDEAHREALMALQGKEYQFHIQGKFLYYAYSRKYEGNRRNIDFERVLGVFGTSRSYKVVNKLIELSKLT